MHVSIETNSMKPFIIGVIITFVLLIITGMICFYILRRRCIHSNSKRRSRSGHESTIESFESYTSGRTDASNITYLTGSPFLS